MRLAVLAAAAAGPRPARLAGKRPPPGPAAWCSRTCGPAVTPDTATQAANRGSRGPVNAARGGIIIDLDPRPSEAPVGSRRRRGGGATGRRAALTDREYGFRRSGSRAGNARAGNARAGNARAGNDEAIARIDGFCDAVPRQRARAEAHDPFVLFVPKGPGWPYYARPKVGPRERVTAAHVLAVRARQRELRVPEAFEWIQEAAPDFAPAAAEAGLDVTAHPLMILDSPPARAELPAGLAVRIVRWDDPDLARIVAVPDVAFAHPGTSIGPAGPAERDKLAAGRDEAGITRMRETLAAGHSVLAAAFDSEGPLAAGSGQSSGGVAEITGVGTLPSARRRGLGAAVTAELAAVAIAGGTRTVFLSASDDAVARVYAGLGFRRIGTAMIAEPG